MTLVEDGLLTWTQDEPACLVPARSPDRTPVAELIHRVGRLAAVDPEGEGGGLELATILEREYSGRTWADLALAEEP